MSNINQAAQSQGPVPIGALPDNTAQQDTASMGLEIQKLFKQNSELDNAIMKVLPAAITPQTVGGQSAVKLPSGLSFNVAQPQFNPPQGSRDARNQGIAKTIAGAGNLIGQIVKVKQAEKTRALAIDIERILSAQEAISQAQATLQNDPDNKKAQASLQKHTQLINDLASDPKKQKQLEKAFSIDHMKPEENKGMEHDARKMATKSFAERLEAATPTKQVENTAAKAQVAGLSAQKAANEAQLKAWLPLYNQQEKDRNANARTAALIEGANARNKNTQDQENLRKEAELNQKELQRQQQWQESINRNLTLLKATGMREFGETARNLTRINARDAQIEKIKGTKPEQAAKLDTQNAKEMNDLLKNSAQIIANNEALKTNFKGDTKQLDATINNAKENQKLATTWLREYSIRSNAKAGGAELDPQPQKGNPNATPAGSSDNKSGEGSEEDGFESKILNFVLGNDDSENPGSDNDTNPANY